MKRLNIRTFESFLSKHEIALVLFGAPDGAATMRAADAFAKAWADEADAAGFGYLDAMAESRLTRWYGVDILPTVVAFQKGEMVSQLSGDLTCRQLSAAILDASSPLRLAA